MAAPLDQHVARLTLLCGSTVAATVACCVLVYFLPPPTSPLAQASHLLLLFSVLALLNLVTLTPVHRAMLAGPLRVWAVSQELPPLLHAHLMAEVVLYARLEAIAVLGLLLFILAGRSDWFWAFSGLAVAGMLVLWPTRGRVATTLGLS